MSQQAITLIVGGTSGIGRALARTLASRGDPVIVTGRDAERSAGIARELGGGAQGLALDLTRPETIAEALRSVGPVSRLVICAIERDANGVRTYDVAGALRLVTLKLVGYTEVVHALCGRFTEQASMVLLGGLAKDRPYPGSTTVSTVNGGVAGMVHTLAVELAPVRVNGLHPGIIGDTEAWRDKPAEVLDAIVSRTPAGRLTSTEDVTGAILFLLENRGVNGVNLALDGGWLLK